MEHFPTNKILTSFLSAARAAIAKYWKDSKAATYRLDI